MRMLITGANGLLGSRLLSLAVQAGHEVFGGYLSNTPPQGRPVKLDLRDESSIAEAFRQSRPEVVFHCAALTDVDKCETEKADAVKINVEGTRLAARAAVRIGSAFFYVSTDYVFSGSKGLYTEDDPTDPINFYGLTKLQGEREVIASGARYLIARPSVIYGARPASGKVNFALWLIGSLAKSSSVKVISDQYVSPTLNTSLAEMLLAACEQGLTGIYHMSGATRVSRYDFALRLAEAFGFDQSLIEKASLSDFQSKWKARRPADSSLDVTKASSALKVKPMVLNQALEQLKREVYEKCCRG